MALEGGQDTFALRLKNPIDGRRAHGQTSRTNIHGQGHVAMHTYGRNKNGN